MKLRYNERLEKAMRYAGIQQNELAKAVNIAQPSMHHLVTKGKGSSSTVSIALACGVNPLWLETGAGKMLDPITFCADHVVTGEIVEGGATYLLTGPMKENLELMKPLSKDALEKVTSYIRYIATEENPDALFDALERLSGSQGEGHTSSKSGT